MKMEIKYQGCEYTLTTDAEQVNFYGSGSFDDFWTDDEDREHYYTEYAALAESGGGRYRIFWKFEVVKGEEPEPENLPWDEKHIVRIETRELPTEEKTLRELLTSDIDGELDDCGFGEESLAAIPEYVGRDKDGPLYRDSVSNYYIHFNQYRTIEFESPSDLTDEESWNKMVDNPTEHPWF